MLSILAIIGKIILITLLIILAILLLLIFVLLFVPLRYKGRGHFDGNEKPNFDCDLRLSYLLHVFSLHFYTEEEKQLLKIKVLGIPLERYQNFFGFFKKRKIKQKSKKESKDSSDTIQKIENTKNGNDEKDNSIQNKGSFQETHSEQCHKSEQKVKGNQHKKNKKKFSIDSLKQLLQNGVALKDKFKRIYEILSNDICKEAFHCCKNRLFRIIKYIFPKKARFELYLGFEDPAVTGNILSIHAILYHILGDIIILHPYFDEQIMRGNFKFKGHIRSVVLLYHLIRILLDENCRNFYKIVKEEMEHGR